MQYEFNGARLRALRNNANMTIDDLSDASGVSRAMIWRIEHDAVSPSVRILARLCNSVRKSPMYFFDKMSEQPPRGGRCQTISRSTRR